jgi:cytochrome c553
MRHNSIILQNAAFAFMLLFASAAAADQAQDIFDQASQLTPNPERGKTLYGKCVTCHGPEGWGNPGGTYPQIAGQLPKVIIKQLADIRAGNRDNPIMRAFTSQRILAGPQDLADVAAYIAALPMTRDNGQGTPFDRAMGEEIYQRDCAECHGERGEGDVEDHIPALYGQHFNYLMRQFDWIRMGKRRNSDEKMVKQIQGYTAREQSAVLSYTAALKPPEDKLAAPGWRNPDFHGFDRSWRPARHSDRYWGPDTPK